MGEREGKRGVKKCPETDPFALTLYHPRIINTVINPLKLSTPAHTDHTRTMNCVSCVPNTKL